MRISFTGGGTLGSVTPLLAVFEAAREMKPDVQFDWIGTADGPEGRLVREAGITFHSISSGRFRRFLTWRHVPDFFRVIKGFFQARALLKSRRPDVVVTAGSFVAAPVVWAAASRKIPTHVHQLDIRPGLANRLSLPFAASLSVSFEKSLKDFRRPKPVWTGSPVRRAMFRGSAEEGRRLFGLESGVPTVLVTGGGTGAAALNDLVWKAVPFLCPKVQVIHLTGAGKSVPYPDAPSRYHQLEFITAEMPHAYAASDLVVTRAGVGALTELAALGVPTIIVPIPASHQEDNARLFAAAGAAVVLDELSTFSKHFAATILGLLEDQKKLADLRARVKKLTKPDAATKVAELVIAAGTKR